MLDIDTLSFAQAFGRDPLAVGHGLSDHPLLQLDALADLADRFAGRIERHRADRLPTVMPGDAPELEDLPSQTVRGIDHNGCWMVFWYVEQDPEYSDLLDRCLNEAELHFPRGVGMTCQREAFVFLSAPNAVTPVHFDPEPNFLLQIRGDKDMNVSRFSSAECPAAPVPAQAEPSGRHTDRRPRQGVTLDGNPGTPPEPRPPQAFTAPRRRWHSVPLRPTFSVRRFAKPGSARASSTASMQRIRSPSPGTRSPIAWGPRRSCAPVGSPRGGGPLARAGWRSSPPAEVEPCARCCRSFVTV